MAASTICRICVRSVRSPRIPLGCLWCEYPWRSRFSSTRYKMVPRSRKNSSRSVITTGHSSTVISDSRFDDFFGIEEHDRESQHFDHRRTSEDDLLEQFDLKPVTGRQVEKVYVTNYGILRLDTDNVPFSERARKGKSSQLQHFDSDKDNGYAITRSRFRNKLSDLTNTGKRTEDLKDVNVFDQASLGAVNHERRVVFKETHKAHSSDSYIEEQYFGQSAVEPDIVNTSLKDFTTDHRKVSTNADDSHQMPYNAETDLGGFIDEQYFAYKSSERTGGGLKPEIFKPDSKRNLKFRNVRVHDSLANVSETDTEQAKFNFIDDQYFNYDSTAAKRVHKVDTVNCVKLGLQESKDGVQIMPATQFVNNQHPGSHLSVTEKDANGRDSTGYLSDDVLHSDTTQSNHVGALENEYNNPTTVFEKKREKSIKFDIENPKTAFDMAMKIRVSRKQKHEKKKGEDDVKDTEPKRKYSGLVDSQGYRILKGQVLDFSQISEDVVVRILKDSILYNRDGLLAINKPYGLACHGGPGIHNSVARVLPRLARILEHSDDLRRYQLVHRLDHETTGVLLIAKNPEMTWKLRGMFKRREVMKIYWAITKGVPQPPEGVINIPMTEGHVNHVYRMVLRPDHTEETRQITRRSSHDVAEAITNFKVLDSRDNGALVELHPLTGVKHQLRCHMAFAMNTPILGDHKYSHYGKIAPQRLHPDMLMRLGIRQSKARHVPMHLHAKTIVLPEFREGRNLFISANLPKHFKMNMKRLKLTAS